MPGFSFISLMVSEENCFIFHFSKNYPSCGSGNQSNKAIRTNVIRNVKDYSINISVKEHSRKYKYL